MFARLFSWNPWGKSSSDDALLQNCGFSKDNPQKTYASIKECIKDGGLDPDFWRGHSIHFEKGRAIIVDGKGDGPKKIEAVVKHALSTGGLSLREKSDFLAGVKMIFRAHGWKMEEPGLERLRSKTSVTSSGTGSPLSIQLASSSDDSDELVHVYLEDDLSSPSLDSIKVETVPVQVESKGRTTVVEVSRSFYNRSPSLKNSSSPTITLSENVTISDFQAYIDFAEDPNPDTISFLTTLQIAEDMGDQATIDKFLTLYKQQLIHVDLFDIQTVIHLLPNFSDQMANQIFSFYVNQYIRGRLEELSYKESYIPNKLEIICSELMQIPGFQEAVELRSIDLDLHGTDITEDDLFCLENTFPHVHSLDVSKTNLYEIPLIWKKDLEKLNITDSFVSQVAKGFLRLKKIDAKETIFLKQIPYVQEAELDPDKKGLQKKRSFFNF